MLGPVAVAVVFVAVDVVLVLVVVPDGARVIWLFDSALRLRVWLKQDY